MDELLQQFLSEGRDLVSTAHEALAALARNPGDRQALESGFRTFHTLKGSVAIVGMTAAERLLHAAEEVLSTARKQGVLPAARIAPLTACIDQVDRWIDAIERDGEVGELPEMPALLMADLTVGAVAAIDPGTPGPDTRRPAWLAPLLALASDAIRAASEPLVAFRYTPDPDCFYRGEDPLAFAASVPGLEFLRIEPVEPWPEISELDPFRCAVAIEGLCEAGVDEVRRVFRFMPDQIALAQIDPQTAAAAMPVPVAAAATRTLRVDADRLDRLGEDVREIIVATNALTALADGADRLDRDLARHIRLAHAGIERASARLRDSATALRRVALGTSLRRLPRLVREIAGGLGKPVRFEMRGEGLEADKDIVEGIFEPLLHLSRNAIDHGIEDTASRVAAGKPAEGRLSLHIEREGGEILVTLEDDGGGIDPERIREIAIARGVVSSSAAERLGPTELHNLIFAPGFSTASKVTEISGRGIGMNAVRAALDRLGGTIELDSRVGAGTRFVMRLPVRAITTRLLIVTVRGERYGVPFDQIRGTVRLPGNRLLAVGTGFACILRDRAVPVLNLARLLGEPDTDAMDLKLLITELFDGSDVAVRVDEFSHTLEGIVRPGAGLLARANGLQGTAIAPDGAVLLVLNLPELVE